MMDSLGPRGGGPLSEFILCFPLLVFSLIPMRLTDPTKKLCCVFFAAARGPPYSKKKQEILNDGLPIRKTSASRGVSRRPPSQDGPRRRQAAPFRKNAPNSKTEAVAALIPRKNRGFCSGGAVATPLDKNLCILNDGSPTR